MPISAATQIQGFDYENSPENGSISALLRALPRAAYYLPISEGNGSAEDIIQAAAAELRNIGLDDGLTGSLAPLFGALRQYQNDQGVSHVNASLGVLPAGFAPPLVGGKGERQVIFYAADGNAPQKIAMRNELNLAVHAPQGASQQLAGVFPRQNQRGMILQITRASHADSMGMEVAADAEEPLPTLDELVSELANAKWQHDPQLQQLLSNPRHRAELGALLRGAKDKSFIADKPIVRPALEQLSQIGKNDPRVRRAFTQAILPTKVKQESPAVAQNKIHAVDSSKTTKKPSPTTTPGMGPQKVASAPRQAAETSKNAAPTAQVRRAPNPRSELHLVPNKDKAAQAYLRTGPKNNLADSSAILREVSGTAAKVIAAAAQKTLHIASKGETTVKSIPTQPQIPSSQRRNIQKPVAPHSAIDSVKDTPRGNSPSLAAEPSKPLGNVNCDAAKQIQTAEPAKNNQAYQPTQTRQKITQMPQVLLDAAQRFEPILPMAPTAPVSNKNNTNSVVAMTVAQSLPNNIPMGYLPPQLSTNAAQANAPILEQVSYNQNPLPAQAANAPVAFVDLPNTSPLTAPAAVPIETAPYKDPIRPENADSSAEAIICGKDCGRCPNNGTPACPKSAQKSIEHALTSTVVIPMQSNVVEINQPQDKGLPYQDPLRPTDTASTTEAIICGKDCGRCPNNGTPACPKSAQKSIEHALTGAVVIPINSAEVPAQKPIPAFGAPAKTIPGFSGAAPTTQAPRAIPAFNPAAA